jgi:glycosyltransferase involved in cell wall biosynthesis
MLDKPTQDAGTGSLADVALSTGRRPTISIVTPCYNEEAGIAACVEAVRAILAETLPGYSYEHILIDNCSQDRTPLILRGLASLDPKLKIIFNARNFGPARSPFHAVLEAKGRLVIPILADLQTPPSLIPRMVASWENGAKVVIAIKNSSDESLFWRTARGAFYKLIKRISTVEQVPNFIGFGLYDECVIDVLRGLNEPEPYFRGLITEIGFERSVVYYDQPKRLHGRSSYTIFSLADYAMLGLASYSKLPLRLMTIVGFSVACLSFLCGFTYLIVKLVFWYSLPVGVAPILISIFFLSSIQLFALGILGEYVSLLLTYARRFPLVVEKERINF